MRYFLITGLDNEYPIEPYIVVTDADFPDLSHFNKSVDSVRYYEQLTEIDVIELLKIDSIEVY